ncbi:MAG: hypothetical protein ACSLFR_07520 [Solirubrobacteraceae bacterium]
MTHVACPGKRRDGRLIIVFTNRSERSRQWRTCHDVRSNWTLPAAGT